MFDDWTKDLVITAHVLGLENISSLNFWQRPEYLQLYRQFCKPLTATYIIWHAVSQFNIVWKTPTEILELICIAGLCKLLLHTREVILQSKELWHVKIIRNSPYIYYWAYFLYSYFSGTSIKQWILNNHYI